MTIEWKNALEAELSALRTAAIADAAEIERLRAEVERLKAQRDALLAAQEGTPCKHKFHVEADGVLFCVYCSASFSEQKEAIAKARGESV